MCIALIIDSEILFNEAGVSVSCKGGMSSIEFESRRRNNSDSRVSGLRPCYTTIRFLLEIVVRSGMWSEDVSRY